MSAQTKKQPKFGPEVTDRFVREDERRLITSISRSQAWVLEQKGLYPRRYRIGSRSVVWKLSELTEWLENQQRVGE